MSGMQQLPATRVVPKVQCPHCWHGFRPEDVLWVSENPQLMGDIRLGQDQQQRFLPTRFTLEGQARDATGAVCHQLACPSCHLTVPRSVLEMDTTFVSILGSPSSGKSYFLAALCRQLRESLAAKYAVSFTDADPTLNRVVIDYEQTLFVPLDDSKLVSLQKTQLQGTLYSPVAFDTQTIYFPRPFVFSAQPMPNHPASGRTQQASTLLVMYDNAGEHFDPGQDTMAMPGTRHLAHSSAILFMYDPTQAPRFRNACMQGSKDPQLTQHGRVARQETVLQEAIQRIRRYRGLGQTAVLETPLIVVVTKFDVWNHLLGMKSLPEISEHVASVGSHLLNMTALDGISARVRDLLRVHCPEVIGMAEGFSRDVRYVPCSALGRSPEVDPVGGMLGIRPRDIRPLWAEVPMLYALHRLRPTLIRAGSKKG